MTESIEQSLDPLAPADAAGREAGAAPRDWGRPLFFFLLGFLVLAEPLMLVLLLVRNGS
jgi:hypothetical protein